MLKLKNSKLVVLSTIIVSILLTGCNGIHRKGVLGNVQTLSVDAKQRLVFHNPKNDRTCAEPSPDAIAVRAAALSTNFSTPSQVSGALGLSSNESAGSIGLRTQTIQILRDGYFRICEAYLNDAIDEKAYAGIISNVDGAVAVVLALDTLGGTDRAPAIALNGGQTAVSAGENQSAGTTAPATPLVIEAIANQNDDIDQSRAAAIENIIKAYLKHIQWRSEFKLRAGI